MSTKKVSYIKILKEAIAEFDTSKNVDVKGPMLDAIVSYKGDGELQTHKDAASILERYYFGENEESSVNIDENVDNEIDEVPGKQDGDVGKEKKQIEDEITNDDSSIKEAAEDEDEKDEDEKEEITEQDEKDEDEDEKEIEEKYSIENSIIEKLIEEMEEEGDEGEGTKAAGTGTAEKEIPPRKDKADSMVKPAKLEAKEAVAEQDEKEEDEEVEEAAKVVEQDEKDEEVLDVDKELGDEEKIEEADDGVGPGPVPSMQRKHKTGDQNEEDVEEAFKIFKEQIEEADVEEIDSDKVRV